MKKIILSAVAILAFGFANAQDKKEGGAGFAKGDLFLSGRLNFSNEKTGDVKNDGLTFAPSAGYFLTDNWALVGGLEIGSTKNDNGVTSTKTSTTGINVGANYYFTPANQFSLSLGGRISYMTSKDDSTGTDVDTKEMGLRVPVGLHYFVSDNFAITAEWAGLGYSTNDNGGDGAEKTNTIDLDVNMKNIGFGLLYKL